MLAGSTIKHDVQHPRPSALKGGGPQPQSLTLSRKHGFKNKEPHARVDDGDDLEMLLLEIRPLKRAATTAAVDSHQKA